MACSRPSELALLLALAALPCAAEETMRADVLVIGGGTGGVAAGIQSARLGAQTLVAEPTLWLGGMLSAAGVSAADGNHRLPSGLWKEFRDRVYQVYGGSRAVATGWVSNTHFEPRAADRILKSMAAEPPALRVLFRHRFLKTLKRGRRVEGALFLDEATGRQVAVRADSTVDATELGDVLADAGAAYDLGLEADAVSGESAGVQESSPMVQDLTYAAILKDYGPGSDRTLPVPEGYDPEEFDCACSDRCRDKTRDPPDVDCRKMLDYAKLPRGKYLINWPRYGNDIYLEIVEKSEEERRSALKAAKLQTLRFVYFIQRELGFKNLGLADDEFPTDDRLPLLPYHREGRRVRGLARLRTRDIAEPYAQEEPLYRTGAAVGDYPIDHHHRKNPRLARSLRFQPIPSFSVPLGALIPVKVDGLVAAEKGISVTSVVNGTTRLQPCVLLTGQAAGALAALSARRKLEPRAVKVRDVQAALLDEGAFLLPYLDVPPEHPQFRAVQKVGAAGILKGEGVPYQWANQTWFYPDAPAKSEEFLQGLREFQGGAALSAAGPELRVFDALRLLSAPPDPRPLWASLKLKDYDAQRLITRAELAALTDALLRPFERRGVDHHGRWN
ncbi:MAG TPA: FAD-dependent oxidoreductase [Elusimicrobia bacterium]|nr:FAD-dependent oxidoreductase [Elusimicrobiota bacterium]